jgi:Cytochrome c7 and related cytochrome c
MFKLSKITNKILKQAIVIVVLLGGAGTLAAVVFSNSSFITGEGEFVEQPLAFSHQLHVNDVGLKCEYCHSGTNKKNSADMPSLETCYGCHREILKGTDFLKPVREGYLKETSIRWNRVNKLADHVHFNHSRHIQKGVQCITCHGDVGKMPLMAPEHHFNMKYCLDCHRTQSPKLQDCYTCHR